jgi:hypothetical protein
MLLAKTPIRPFLVLTTIALLAGCVSVVKIDGPHGDLQGNEWLATGENEFSFSGITLRILPVNIEIRGAQGPIIPFIPYWQDYGGKPFAVFLRFSKDEKARLLYFNPQRTHLVLNSVPALSPSHVVGPLPSSCEHPQKDEKERPSEQQILISDAVCIVLHFEQEAPRLGQRFSVIVEGLTESKRELAPLRIDFVETKSQWLVGVGPFLFQVN